MVDDLHYRFYTRCAHAGLPELERLATTVETWRPEIEAPQPTIGVFSAAALT